MYKRNGIQRRTIERISSSKSKARIAASVGFFSLIFVYWRLVSTLLLENQVHSIERRDPILLHQAYRRPKTNNTLEFVHITKTGGTAIERAAARINIPWGVCHFVPKQHCLGVKPDLGFPHAFPLKRDIPFHGKFSKAEYWHTPPHWFVDNPFEGKDSFVVVRNPYDRYISEFYCRYYGYRRNERLGTTNWNPSDRVARFQHLIRQKEAFQSVKRKNIQRANVKQHRGRLFEEKVQQNATLFNNWFLQKLKTYNGRTGHMLPQHYYVYDANGKQVVTHILKFESLQQDFIELMKLYKLNISLTEERINPGVDENQRLTRANLSGPAIAAINHFARDDFHLFGYEMMDPSL